MLFIVILINYCNQLQHPKQKRAYVVESLIPCSQTRSCRLDSRWILVYAVSFLCYRKKIESKIVNGIIIVTNYLLKKIEHICRGVSRMMLKFQKQGIRCYVILNINGVPICPCKSTFFSVLAFKNDEIFRRKEA